MLQAISNANPNIENVGTVGVLAFEGQEPISASGQQVNKTCNVSHKTPMTCTILDIGQELLGLRKISELYHTVQATENKSRLTAAVLNFNVPDCTHFFIAFIQVLTDLTW